MIMGQRPESNSQRYTRQVTDEFLTERSKVGQMTPELLLIFADGTPEILRRVAAGLAKVSPGDPDLPIIHAVYHQLAQSSSTRSGGAGPGKGRKPVYSLPLEEVPERLLNCIGNSRHGDRLRRDLTYALREILGAARRSGMPEELTRDALSAYLSELETRDISAKTLERKLKDVRSLGELFALEASIQILIERELQGANLAGKHEPSKRHAAFRAAPLSPLDYARLAHVASKEAFSTSGNRQTVQKLFITAAALALLSFIPERVSDILGAVVGKDVTRDARGWSSEYFSRKSNVDRTFEHLPDQLTPFLDDLILLGAEPGARGCDLARLYKHRVSLGSPLFAKINLVDPYSGGRIFELTKERSGHGPHAARNAMTDYLAEIGAAPEDVLDLLGHKNIATSRKHYAVRADAHQRKRTLLVVDHLREALSDDGVFRLPTGQLIDLNRISREIERTNGIIRTP
ncbi:hypothetical protein [Alloyangia pacifica]|nr:hypothetical protein [Alloyangia pacifica]